MSTTRRTEFFGPYKIIRPLGSARDVERFVVLCTKTDTNRMLYRFENQVSHQQRRSLFDAMVTLSTLDHPHLLRIESASYDDRGRLCLITPYTGNHDGLVTLSDLIEKQGGKLTISEAARAIEHLLSASAYAHGKQIAHGPIYPDQILVDRFGSLQVQLYAHPAKTSEARINTLIADEIRSIAQLGYAMITGLGINSDRLSPTRVVKKLDRNWDAWFDIALDPIDGFEDAVHAMRALPTNPDCEQWLTSRVSKRVPVQFGSMIRRFRSASVNPSRR